MRVMITHDGPHPAHKLATEMAGQIADLIQIDPRSSSPEAIEAQRAKPEFERQMARLFEDHHAAVQKHERHQIKKLGDDRLTHPLEPGDSLDGALADVLAASKVSPIFEAHFAKPDIQRIVRNIIGSWLNTTRDIERSHHADKSDSNLAKAYKHAREHHGGGHAHAFMSDYT